MGVNCGNYYLNEKGLFDQLDDPLDVLWGWVVFGFSKVRDIIIDSLHVVNKSFVFVLDDWFVINKKNRLGFFDDPLKKQKYEVNTL